MAKDLFPKTFKAEVGQIKIETDERITDGISIASVPGQTVLSKLDVYDFITSLAEKAGLEPVLDETTGTLTVSRPENLLVQQRRQELADKYGDRPFSQLDQVSQNLINHIIDEEVGAGKHKRPNKPK